VAVGKYLINKTSIAHKVLTYRCFSIFGSSAQFVFWSWSYNHQKIMSFVFLL